MIETLAGELDVRLPVSPEQLASAVIAMFEGFMLQKLVEPGRFSTGSFGSLLTLFVRGIAALAGEDQPSVTTEGGSLHGGAQRG
jgi:hypothetical protein